MPRSQSNVTLTTIFSALAVYFIYTTISLSLSSNTSDPSGTSGFFSFLFAGFSSIAAAPCTYLAFIFIVNSQNMPVAAMNEQQIAQYRKKITTAVLAAVVIDVVLVVTGLAILLTDTDATLTIVGIAALFLMMSMWIVVSLTRLVRLKIVNK